MHQKSMKEEIKLGTGLGDIRFGLNMDEIETLLGEPEEIEESDDEDEFEHQAWNYWDEGYSLYFDKEDDYRLSCIETANPNVTLWGKRIFEMNQPEIMEMFKEKGITDYETEKLDTGEVRLSYEREMIDLYFEDGRLLAINFGVFIGDDLEVKWPQ